jgi:pyruvate dehydrogenase E1 component
VLASGVAMTWALEAQRRLADEWDVAADVWSVTSWTELAREATRCERAALRRPGEAAPVPHVRQVLEGRTGPVVAVSDWMRAVPDQIAPWIPGDWSALGTDGFGLSDTRHALRRHFLVDAGSIVVQVLRRLAATGQVAPEVAAEAATRYRLDDPHFFPVGVSAGGDT